MIVVCLSDCPPKLRGDLTKWLHEIDIGVYAGNTTARVRDELWKRIVDTCKNGRVTMVFTTRNEQGMDFRIHNAVWKPIDFDGLKLLLRPSNPQSNRSSCGNTGMSRPSAIHNAKKYSHGTRKIKNPLESFLVITIKTTGPSEVIDDITSLCAFIISNGQVIKSIDLIFTIDNPIKTDESVPLPPHESIDSPHMGNQQWKREQWTRFLNFAADWTVISHEAESLYRFIRTACARNVLPLFSNPCIDTLALSRRIFPDLNDFSLPALVKLLCIRPNGEKVLLSREIGEDNEDIRLLVSQLYYKLIEIHLENSR